MDKGFLLLSVVGMTGERRKIDSMTSSLLFKKFKILLREDYFRNNLIHASLVISAALNIALWFYLSTQIQESRYSIALHYTIYFGIDFLGEARQALVLAFVGLIVLVTNIILGFYLYSHSRIASYFLSVTSILVQIFLFFAAYGLVMINK